MNSTLIDHAKADKTTPAFKGLMSVKIKALLWHLLLSAGIFAAVISLAAYFWYPAPFFLIDGGWEGVRLIAFVDLVLGPLLTFVAYKPGKKGLFWDLSLIGLLQVVVLSFGVHTLYKERVIALVYAYDSFYVVSASTYKAQDIPWDSLDDFSGNYPKTVVVTDSEGAENDMKNFLQISNDVPDFRLAIQHYEPLMSNIDRVLDKGRDIEYAIAEKPTIQPAVDAFLLEHGGTLADYAFIPVYARYYNYLMAVRLLDNNLVGVMEVKVPYPNDFPYAKDKLTYEPLEQVSEKSEPVTAAEL